MAGLRLIGVEELQHEKHRRMRSATSCSEGKRERKRERKDSRA
jgi:hypothetical protein